MKVCKECWWSRSGWKPTVVDDVKYRPIQWLSGIQATCSFCRQHKVGMYVYGEVDE